MTGTDHPGQVSSNSPAPSHPIELERVVWGKCKDVKRGYELIANTLGVARELISKCNEGTTVRCGAEPHSGATGAALLPVDSGTTALVKYTAIAEGSRGYYYQRDCVLLSSDALARIGFNVVALLDLLGEERRPEYRTEIPRLRIDLPEALGVPPERLSAFAQEHLTSQAMVSIFGWLHPSSSRPAQIVVPSTQMHPALAQLVLAILPSELRWKLGLSFGSVVPVHPVHLIFCAQKQSIQTGVVVDMSGSEPYLTPQPNPAVEYALRAYEFLQAGPASARDLMAIAQRSGSFEAALANITRLRVVRNARTLPHEARPTALIEAAKGLDDAARIETIAEALVDLRPCRSCSGPSIELGDLPPSLARALEEKVQTSLSNKGRAGEVFSVEQTLCAWIELSDNASWWPVLRRVGADIAPRVVQYHLEEEAIGEAVRSIRDLLAFIDEPVVLVRGCLDHARGGPLAPETVDEALHVGVLVARSIAQLGQWVNMLASFGSTPAAVGAELLTGPVSPNWHQRVGTAVKTSSGCDLLLLTITRAATFPDVTDSSLGQLVREVLRPHAGTPGVPPEFQSRVWDAVDQLAALRGTLSTELAGVLAPFVHAPESKARAQPALMRVLRAILESEIGRDTADTDRIRVAVRGAEALLEALRMQECDHATFATVAAFCAFLAPRASSQDERAGVFVKWVMKLELGERRSVEERRNAIGREMLRLLPYSGLRFRTQDALWLKLGLREMLAPDQGVPITEAIRSHVVDGNEFIATLNARTREDLEMLRQLGWAPWQGWKEFLQRWLFNPKQ